MPKYLADTNILIDYLRGIKSAYDFLHKNQPAISTVSVAELIQGVRNKTELKQVDAVISSLEVIELDERISHRSLVLMHKHFLSNGLLFLDALIAATAIENKLTLITANTKHFKFIQGLTLQ
ncbi:MAG: type II toxin-antitoxin system VapC family toxin [bacterium]|nr:type II toxin-antitoxin system VapC family toxin [bacterium]